MSSTLATVGILSVGEMGLGIAKLLIAHNYRVVTNITGRRYLSFDDLLLDFALQFAYFTVYLLPLTPLRELIRYRQCRYSNTCP